MAPLRLLLVAMQVRALSHSKLRQASVRLVQSPLDALELARLCAIVLLDATRGALRALGERAQTRGVCATASAVPCRHVGQPAVPAVRRAEIEHVHRCGHQLPRTRIDLRDRVLRRDHERPVLRLCEADEKQQRRNGAAAGRRERAGRCGLADRRREAGVRPGDAPSQQLVRWFACVAAVLAPACRFSSGLGLGLTHPSIEGAHVDSPARIVEQWRPTRACAFVRVREPHDVRAHGLRPHRTRRRIRLAFAREARGALNAPKEERQVASVGVASGRIRKRVRERRAGDRHARHRRRRGLRHRPSPAPRPPSAFLARSPAPSPLPPSSHRGASMPPSLPTRPPVRRPSRARRVASGGSSTAARYSTSGQRCA